MMQARRAAPLKCVRENWLWEVTVLHPGRKTESRRDVTLVAQGAALGKVEQSERVP